MDIYWDGDASEEGMGEEVLRLAHTFADSCRDQDWGLVFLFLNDIKTWINSTRPGGNTLDAPLHHAARGGAEPDVVRRLIKLGALRTLRNASGERPVDLAVRYGHDHLVRDLAPVIHREIPATVLFELESSFHAIIRDRLAEFDVERTVRFPLLEPLLELKKPQMCFYVDEMWGGFYYKLKRARSRPLLTCESRHRMTHTANLRHEIWPGGSRLIKKGFR